MVCWASKTDWDATPSINGLKFAHVYGKAIASSCHRTKQWSMWHNDENYSQPHFEEMVLSSQPLLLQSGAWMNVKRMKTHTNT